MNQLGTLLPLVLILAGGYFLLIRPTRKRAQEADALQKALAVGVEVMLTSGIFGTVRAIVDEKIDIEIAPGVVITVHRGAISRILTPFELEGPPDADEVDADDREAPTEQSADEPGTAGGNDATGSDVEPGVTDDTDTTGDGADGDDDNGTDPDARGAH